MLNQYILLVSNSEKGFLANALYEGLKKGGVEVKSIAIADVSLVSAIDDSFGVLIADTCENPYALNNIKNKCYELGRKVILYGNAEELNAMKRVFVDSMIYKELLRPVETEDVLYVVRQLQAREENRKIMKKILVVDDNGVFLRSTKACLEGQYEVILANSAASATNALLKVRPDLILLDYEMPVCSGAEFMQSLSQSERTRSIPVMFLTSRNDAETVSAVMTLKPRGYILKDMPQEDFLSKIEAFFDR